MVKNTVTVIWTECFRLISSLLATSSPVVFYFERSDRKWTRPMRLPWRRSWQATHWCKQRPRLKWARFRSGSYFRYGRRTEQAKLECPPSYFFSNSLSLSLFLRLSVSPSIIHPYASFGYLERVSPAGSIHPSHVSSAVVPSGSCVHRHDAWLKGSQQCSSSCQTQRGRRLKNSCPSWSAPLRNGFTVAVREKLDFVKSLAEP